MELRRYLQILRRKLPLVVLSVLLGMVAGYLATPRTARYTATATLYVGSRVINPDPRIGELSNDRATAIDRIVQTYAELIRTEASAAAALNKAGVPLSPQALVGATVTEPVVNTTLLKVSVTDPDPGTAQTLATALASSFVDRLADLEPAPTTADGITATTDVGSSGDDGSGGSSGDDSVVAGIPATVSDPAKLPVVPEPTGLTRNLLLGALFGLVISVGIVALLEYLDITIKSPSEAERRLELPVLGALPLHTGRVSPTAHGNGVVAKERARG